MGQKHDHAHQATAESKEAKNNHAHGSEHAGAPSYVGAASEFYSQNLVRSSNPLRLLSYTLVLILVLLIVLLTIVPWVQTVTGYGQVTALLPSQRPQFLDAQITGRLVRWAVLEGQDVKAGDTIAVLLDIDSKFLDTALIQNQEKQIAALEERRLRANSQLSAFTQQIGAEQNARDAGVKSALEKLRQMRQRRISAEERIKQADLDLEIAQQRFKDRETLYKNGIISLRSFENARAELQRAEVSNVTIKADAEASRRAVDEAEESMRNKDSEGFSKVLKVMSDEQKALETIASIDNSLAKARSELNAILVRREAAVLRSPASGKVVRLYAFGAGETVKQGDRLAIIMPRADNLAVEIFVSGNDAPLLSPGREVRLQFDGFPAFQISGWPLVAVGTFGGTIQVVDAVTDDKNKGTFRVLVMPKKDDDKWPDAQYLRPGTKAAAWMQLNVVSLGFELWRQFNGFPVSIQEPKPVKKSGDGVEPKKDDDKGDASDDAK